MFAPPPCPVCPTLSPDAVLAGLTGLAASVVGALAALAATWFTLRHTEKAERKRRSEERQQEHEHQLKDAYVEWFHAAHRLLNLAIELRHKVFDLSQNPPDLAKAVRDDPVFMGARIELQDPDAEARDRLKFAIRAFGTNVDSLFATPDPKKHEAATDAISLAFKDLRHWLVSVRFKPGYTIQTQSTRKPVQKTKS